MLLVVGDEHRALDDASRMNLTDAGKQERLKDGTLPIYSSDVLDILKSGTPILPVDAYKD